MSQIQELKNRIKFIETIRELIPFSYNYHAYATLRDSGYNSIKRATDYSINKILKAIQKSFKISIRLSVSKKRLFLNHFLLIARGFSKNEMIQYAQEL